MNLFSLLFLLANIHWILSVCVIPNTNDYRIESILCGPSEEDLLKKGIEYISKEEVPSYYICKYICIKGLYPFMSDLIICYDGKLRLAGACIERTDEYAVVPKYNNTPTLSITSTQYKRILTPEALYLKDDTLKVTCIDNAILNTGNNFCRCKPGLSFKNKQCGILKDLSMDENDLLSITPDKLSNYLSNRLKIFVVCEDGYSLIIRDDNSPFCEKNEGVQDKDIN